MTSCETYARLAKDAPKSAFLGAGSFGRVVQVVDPVDPDQKRAVKLQKAQFTASGLRDRFEVTEEYENTQKMSRDNPWIMRVFSSCFTDDFDVIVMERLYPFMTKEGRSAFTSGLYSARPVGLLKTTTDTAFDVALDLVSGLVTMHIDKMVHRDIKPANLAIRLTPNDPKAQYRVVYIDLGLAGSSIQGCQISGTEVYQPPEFRLSSETIQTLCKHIKPAERPDAYNACCHYLAQMADVWALGMTLLEFITGQVVYEDVDRSFPTSRSVKENDPRMGRLEWDASSNVPKMVARLQRQVRGHPRFEAVVDVIKGMLHPSLTPEKFSFQGGKIHNHRSSSRPFVVKGGGEPVRLTAREAHTLLMGAI